MNFGIWLFKLDSHKGNDNHIISKLDKAFFQIYMIDNHFSTRLIYRRMNPNAASEKGNMEEYSLPELAIFFEKLLSDGYIYLSGESYLITVEGKLFQESVGKGFEGRPYQYKEALNKLNSRWQTIKIIGAIINAIVLILIGFLTIYNN